MLQAAQDTFLGVEDLHCHQIALLTFLQETQICKGLLMLKGSMMEMLAKRPCLCSTIQFPDFLEDERDLSAPSETC